MCALSFALDRQFGKYNAGLRFIGQVLYNSLGALGLLLFFVVVGSIVSGSLIYYAERGEWLEIEGASVPVRILTPRLIRATCV